MTSPPRSSGRFVVVTGGSRGIGREVLARCVALGDDVLALGRDRDALDALTADAAGWGPGTLRVDACDVSVEADVERCFGPLSAVDVLVNNAGISESAPLHRTTLASWERQMAVNATGAFLPTRAVIAGMRERGTGRIVTVASTAARIGAPYTAAYAASKHAAVGLMRVAAAELAGSGATANAVCPTFVDTEMTQRSVARIAQRTGRSAADSLAALAATAPLGRLVTPEEVADAVLWLASDAAGTINGQTMILDGGGIQA
ncbi:MAG TPA: SDR family NAD(P)-dependent oxidoreductase [Baekduia sp.]|nr:SDR family NAD(P)-dependent oxidoreductase [Baekduia sp.]